MPDNHLLGIEKPGRYIGLELNTYRKSFDEASVRFALAFPDVYEIGMSHLGLKLLYHLFEPDRKTSWRIESIRPGRITKNGCGPWENRSRGIESGQPLGCFDFLGFSLQYELSYSNILTILDVANIPLFAADRSVEHPFVIGGGPCAFNPEPVADFFDFFVLGEAEEVLAEIIGVYKDWKKKQGRSRYDFLYEVRKIPGDLRSLLLRGLVSRER